MALDVKTKRRIRAVIGVVLGLVAAWVVILNWNRILPAIGAGTEKAYEATQGIADAD